MMREESKVYEQLSLLLKKQDMIHMGSFLLDNERTIQQNDFNSAIMSLQSWISESQHHSMERYISAAPVIAENYHQLDGAEEEVTVFRDGTCIERVEYVLPTIICEVVQSSPVKSSPHEKFTAPQVDEYLESETPYEPKTPKIVSRRESIEKVSNSDVPQVETALSGIDREDKTFTIKTSHRLMEPTPTKFKRRSVEDRNSLFASKLSVKEVNESVLTPIFSPMDKTLSEPTVSPLPTPEETPETILLTPVRDPNKDPLNYLMISSCSLAEHPLLNKLRLDLISVIDSQRKLLNDTYLANFVVATSAPKVVNILYDLNQIFSHRATNTFFKGQRNVYTIFTALGPFQEKKGVLLKEFESNPDVKKLDMKNSNNMLLKCIYFVQFLLQRKLIRPLLKQLLQCETYMKECYEPGSVMLSHKCCASLINIGLPVLDDHFKFEFDFINLEGRLKIPEEFLQVDKLVRECIKQLADERSTSTLYTETNHPWLGPWVRTQLAPKLLIATELGAKKSGVFSHSSYHIWEYILKVTKLVHIDIGRAYSLDDIITTVTAVVQNHNSRSGISRSKRDLMTEYFTCFVIYCINYKILDQLLELLFDKRGKLSAFNQVYNSDSPLARADYVEVLCAYLNPISKIGIELELRSS